VKKKNRTGRESTFYMKIHLREGIYSLILLFANVAFLLLFVFYTTKNEMPLNTIANALIIGFITILNWVSVWHTYEHFVFGYRNLARKLWIFQKITETPVNIRGY
jgi:hypothetical protein